MTPPCRPFRPGRRATRSAAATAIVAATLCVGPGAAATPATPAQAVEARPGSAARERFLMGARLSIEATGPDAPGAIEAAFREVERLDGVLSNWRGDSELATLNREAAVHPVSCSPDLYAVVADALRWAAESDGAFDPTVEPLVRRLGLRAPEGRLPGVAPESPDEPQPSAVAAVAGAPRPTVGWRHVQLDPGRRTIRFDAPDVGIDLGGIGKGYALDAALRVLVAHGMRSALLDFSGQILVHGAGPDDGGWIVGVSGPENRERPRETVRVASGSLASSGNGERSVRGRDGPVGHILNPATRMPAVYGGTVSVLATDGVSADALSTALFVMGPGRGTRWAAARHLEVVYLWTSGEGVPGRSGTGRFASASDGGGR